MRRAAPTRRSPTPSTAMSRRSGIKNHHDGRATDDLPGRLTRISTQPVVGNSQPGIRYEFEVKCVSDVQERTQMAVRRRTVRRGDVAAQVPRCVRYRAVPETLS